MLPTINGKSFLECTEADLQELLENPDYRESEYLDYKESFSFLEMPKANPAREAKIVEFRNDVCSFANADGGYLVYGISDDKGMAQNIIGIDIPAGDTDRFELDRKNNLMPIMPKIPAVQFAFIPLANQKYVVIIYIRRDGYTPYIHLEKESNYKIYKRVGNGKICMGYTEMKKMFNQSLSIENEVEAYRRKRIDFYRMQEDTPDKRYSQFALFHIIPDTFTDSYYRKNMFLQNKQRPELKLPTVFYGMSCLYQPQPNIDGIRFPGDDRANEGLLHNNGVAECFCPAKDVYLLNRGDYEKGRFVPKYLWDDIGPVVKQYISAMKGLLETKKLFLCISILGCKGAVTNLSDFGRVIGWIDRDTILCSPIVIEDINDEDEVEMATKWLMIEYYLALGIRNSDELNKLIEEVSKHDNE